MSFPYKKYIDHVIPRTNKADDICKDIMSLIVKTQSTGSFQAIVCDGINTNTGVYNGIIRKLEEALCRSLQWLICLLHFNELPFRRFLFTLNKAKTTSPKDVSSFKLKRVIS